MREKCGQVYNRGRFVCTLVMIPIMIVFLLSDKIKEALGFDPVVSQISKVYLLMLIPGIWGLG